LKIIEIRGGEQLNQIPPPNEISEEIKVKCAGKGGIEVGNFLIDHRYRFRIINEEGHIRYILLPSPERERIAMLTQTKERALGTLNILYILLVSYVLLVIISMIRFLGFQQIFSSFIDWLVPTVLGLIIINVVKQIKRILKEGF
jgi:hypothetical protein